MDIEPIYKCSECARECTLVEECYDYPETHCAPGGGTHCTGHFTSNCCDAPIMEPDDGI